MKIDSSKTKKHLLEELTKAYQRIAALEESVSEHKHAEDMLRESQQLLRQVLNTIPIRVFWKDSSSNYLGCNLQFALDAGLKSPEEVIAKNDFMMSWAQHAQMYRAYDRAVMETGLPKLRYELVETRSDGSKVWLLSSKMPLADTKGAIKGILGIYEDITEQKRTEEALHESEERYRTLLEQAPSAIVVHRDGRVLYANAAAVKLYGAASFEHLTEHNILIDLLHPDDRERIRALSRYDMEAGQTPLTEARILSLDGHEVPVEATGVPVEYQGILSSQVIIRDITKRVEATEALRKSEAKYRFLTEKMNDIIWTADPGFKVSYISPSVEKALGFTPEEAMSMAPEDAMTPASFAHAMETLSKELGCAREEDIDTDRTVELELEYYHKNGSTVWRECAVKAIRNGSGDVVGLHGVSRDITKRKEVEEELRRHRVHMEELVKERTIELEVRNRQLSAEIKERRQAEEALRVAEEKYRMHFSFANDVMFSYDNDFRVLSVSPNVERIIGYKPEELIGKTFSDLKVLDSRDLKRASSDALNVLSGKTMYFTTYRFISKDGTIRFGEVSGVPFIQNDQVAGVISVARDVTERKMAEEALRESENRYRLLAENASDIIFTLDANLRFSYISPSIERIRGYTVEEGMSQRIEEALTPASLEVARKIFQEEIEIEAREQKDLWRTRTIELEETCKDGSTIWTETTFSPLRDKNARLTGLLGITRDISERRSTEEEKKKFENQLMQLQKMEALGRFAGGIAHDMNNILYPIIIDIEMLLEETSQDTGLHETLKQVLKAAYRQKDLVKLILSFSRRSDHTFKAIRISPLLTETLNLLRSSLPRTIDIQQRMSVMSDTVVGDPTQIQQIIMNLCRNAADALGSRKGTIEVSLTNTYLEATPAHPEIKAGNYLQLTVRDTGCGITSEVMDRIFEPFFTTKEVGKGSGMGLAVVHGILKSHGGTVMVESEPGRGSRFHVYLPLSDDMSLKMMPYKERSLPVTGKEKILLVDDEEIVLSSLQRALKRSGYDITPVQDGLDALELFSKTPDEFDLVITDLTMPRITGLELAKNLMNVREIPIILCTGYSDVIDEQEAKTMGIREILLKPSNTSGLNEAIRRALEKR
jgi:PAS domain S-box-containing protein